MVAAAQVIAALQTLVDRETPPLEAALLRIATLEAGTAFHIVPDGVQMGGTFCCFDPQLRERLLASLRRTAEGIAACLRCSAQATNAFLAPAVLNHPALTAVAREAAAEIVGAEKAIQPDPLTGSGESPASGKGFGAPTPSWDRPGPSAPRPGPPQREFRH